MQKRKVRKNQKKRVFLRRKSDEKGDREAQRKRDQRYYRVISGEVGIFEAVNRDCPQNDSRREKKPSGTWIDKVGPEFDGAVSFWTASGLRKYVKSRLLEWHASIALENIFVIIIKKPSKMLHEDKYQIIVDPEFIGTQKKQRLGTFLSEKGMIL